MIVKSKAWANLEQLFNESASQVWPWSDLSSTKTGNKLIAIKLVLTKAADKLEQLYNKLGSEESLLNI